MLTDVLSTIFIGFYVQCSVFMAVHNSIENVQIILFGLKKNKERILF